MMGAGLGRGFWISLAGCAVFFLLLPEVDLWVSGWFYTPEAGFFLTHTWWCRLVYRGVEVFTTAFIITMIGLLLASILARQRLRFLNTRKIVYLLLVLALGPGLLVNALFKEHWGRARPNNIEAFGGAAVFSPAWIITDACNRNCSFVSGHAAMGFYLIAPALLARRRRIMLTGAFAAGSLTGAVRIIQGGHFLSDVVFAGFIVYATAVVLHACMFERLQRKN